MLPILSFLTALSNIACILPNHPGFPHAYCIYFYRISEGQYYEAHQQLRVVASRYVKSSDWESAIDILYSGALALLKAGQGGSGGDLGCFLVDVLGKSEKSCGAGEKGECCARCWEALWWKKVTGVSKLRERT